MHNIYRHTKSYIFKGLLALIPIALTVFTINILYVFIDKQIMDIIDAYTGFHIPGLGLLIFIVLLYATGVIASNVVGRRLFGLLETVTGRIPLINTAYQVGKQLSGTLSLPEKNIFKKAILIDYFRPGAWVIGFVTGELTNNATGEALLKIFIPTVPNPTSGFLVIVQKSQVKETHWTVEEAIKVVISAGIIGPPTINITEE
jgi:uncharacterized membrane protein